MHDIQSIPPDDLGSVRDLPLEKQADCLISITCSLILERGGASGESLDGSLAYIDSKATLSECVESLCRRLSKDETQQLFETTLLRLCDNLTVPSIADQS